MARKSKSKMNDITLMIKDMVKSNQDILKLIKFTDTEIDIYSQPNLSGKDSRELAKKYILERPKEFDDANMACFIVMTYGRKLYHHDKNMFFNGNTFNFEILAHNDIKVNDYVGDRCLEIEAILEDIFSGVKLDGITCKCSVVGSEFTTAKSTNYSGRYVQIAFSDFSRKGVTYGR